MSTSRFRQAAAASVLLSVSLSGPLIGQSAQPNWDYYFRSEGRVDDNVGLTDQPSDTGYMWINTFGLANRSSTRVDEFALDLSGHVRVQDIPIQSETIRFDDPRLELDYNRQVGDDALNFAISANKVDLAFVDALSEGGNLNELDFDDARGDGSREFLGVTLEGVINEDAPLTFEYILAGTQRSYVDEGVEEDLNDLTRYLADASILFDITRTTRGVFDFGYDYRDEDDAQQTLRRRARIGTGLNMALDSRTALNFRIGYSEVRTEQQAFGTEETETGTIGSIALLRELKDGEVNLIYSVDLDENGQRDRLLAGRTFERGNTVYGGDIGIAARELSEDIRPIGSLFVTQELPRARFAAELEQNVDVAEDSEDTVFTRLNLTYEQDFSTDLSFILNLAAGRRFAEEDDNRERRRLNVTASVRNTLTKNWDLDVGYRYRYREGTDASVGTSNAVFAALVRNLQID
ncbi:MAG: hypothetical protein NXH97_21925 [Rhodobacteraceae bacterium]|nr:hypothetical protein [Paracoccaceae bacterium]